jgi:hypothetical protein
MYNNAFSRGWLCDCPCWDANDLSAIEELGRYLASFALNKFASKTGTLDFASAGDLLFCLRGTSIGFLASSFWVEISASFRLLLLKLRPISV